MRDPDCMTALCKIIVFYSTDSPTCPQQKTEYHSVNGGTPAVSNNSTP